MTKQGWVVIESSLSTGEILGVAACESRAGAVELALTWLDGQVQLESEDAIRNVLSRRGWAEDGGVRVTIKNVKSTASGGNGR